MYECPNCAANLKFHIGKQMLFCNACGTSMSPYSFHKSQDAEETKFYETTIFTCPQCGSELITTNDTAATFCSYCGSSTILDSRISHKKAPHYIIPFQKDKEDCQKAYKRMLRYAYFLPKEFKDPEQIEKFRPIYMPFWLYTLKHDGPIKLSQANKIVHSEELYVKYEELSYDASSSFSDDLATAIWPYHLDKKQKFSPAFLSGFYADTRDLNHDLYLEEALDLVTADTIQRIHKDPFHFREFSHGWKLKPVDNTFEFKAEKIDLAMFPVWFLSYRKEDRVAYAVMNGQTGKLAGDMPIAVHKYLLCSLLGAIPIFLLLYCYWNMQPLSLLIISALLSFVSSIMLNMQLSYLIIRENKEKDRGFMSKQRKKQMLKDKKGAFTIPSPFWGILMIILFPIWPFFIMTPPVLLLEKYIPNTTLEFMIVILLILFTFCSYWLLMWGIDRFFLNKRVFWRIKIELFMYGRKKLPYLIRPFVGIVLALLLLCIMPESEMWYYAGSLVCMILTGVTFVNIIKYHNLLTTRKPPQLNRRGGDENA